MRTRVVAVLRLARAPRIFGVPGTLFIAAAWTIVGTLSFARHSAAGPRLGLGPDLLPHYFEWLSCYLPWVLLGGVMVRLEGRLPLGRPGWARNLASLALVSIPVSYGAAAMATVLGAGVRAAFGLPPARRLEWIIPATELLGHQILYWSSVGASGLLRILTEARENERRAARLILEKAQLESSLRQAELDALRMRLQPHFLFNSIQNISVLIEHDPQTASRMLTKLGELLRAALARDGRPETTLQAEIALTSAYLAVEQMRFGDRLSSLVDIAPGTESALVPTFLLQPLVENAILHGLQRVRERGVIVIRSRCEGGSLLLTVADNGAGVPGEAISEKGLGIGLGATCERLARMYPGRHAFAIDAVPEGGTEVRIMLPLRIEPTEEEADRAHAASVDRR